jgi:hypothetical protein
VTNALAHFAAPSATKKQKFITGTIGANVKKILSSTNKIDRFSLASLSILV